MRKAKFIMLLLGVSAPLKANDFSKFYKPVPGLAPSSLVPSTQPTEEVLPSGDVKADRAKMWERGFSPIGFAAFNGPARNTKDALSFGNKIHARYVIIESVHTGTRTGAMTTPLLGSLITSPLVQERFDQTAVFYQEAPHKGIGLIVQPLSDEQKRIVGSNKGGVVVGVRSGSPAYDADILPGDILTGVNGKPANIEDIVEAAKAVTGPVNVSLIRGDQKKAVEVTIGPEWK